MKRLVKKPIIHRIFLLCVTMLIILILYHYWQQHRVSSQREYNFDVGIEKFTLVNPSRAFDDVNGINVGPRIITGEIYYPIERVALSEKPVTLGYFSDHNMNWLAYYFTAANYFYFPQPPNKPILGQSPQDTIKHLNLFFEDACAKTNICYTADKIMAIPLEGVFENKPIASGKFPIILAMPGNIDRPAALSPYYRELARHGYIVASMYALGDTNWVPIGRAGDLKKFPKLYHALQAIPCINDKSERVICFDSKHQAYVNTYNVNYGSDDPKINIYSLKQNEQQLIATTYDRYEVLKAIKSRYTENADISKIGLEGYSASGSQTQIAPLILAKWLSINTQFSSVTVAPEPFPILTLGKSEDGGNSHFGELICAAAGIAKSECTGEKFRLNVNTMIEIHQEDRAVGDKITFYHLRKPLGYGPGLSPTPTLKDPQPEATLIFNAVTKDKKALLVNIPDVDHSDWGFAPGYPSPDYEVESVLLKEPIRLFTHKPYSTLSPQLQREIYFNYRIAFHDLILKDDKRALKQIFTERFKHITQDGLGVSIRTNSEFARP